MSLSLARDADLDGVSEPLTIDPTLAARMCAATRRTFDVDDLADLLARVVADAGAHGVDPLDWLATTEAVLGDTPTAETYGGIVDAIAAVCR